MTRNPPATARLLPLVRRSPALRQAWPDWQALTRDAPPFLSPEFFVLNPVTAAQGEPLVAVAYQGAHMAGALPLLLDGQRNLHTLRTDHTPRYDYWGNEEGLAAIFESLTHDYRWDLFYLRHVPTESLLYRALPEIARRHYCFTTIEPDSLSPNFALPGFEDKLDGKFRTNVRRCARKLGDLRYRRIDHYSRADLDEGFRIEAMAWKAAAGTSISSDRRLERFYRTLARLFGRRGQMSLNFVYSGDKTVAFLFALEDKHTFYALKPGYDPAYANVSPGHLIIYETAKDAEARGLVRFDFMGPQVEWKRRWTETGREHVNLVVYRPSPRGLGRYAFQELKPMIPPGWLAALKRFLP